jgi:pimeloyl-ACP methyl ester carboxylesterase
MRLAFDDTGSGDCVVLIHGHPFDRRLWAPQAAGLRDRFRVVVPDLRGFGESPVTPHSVTMGTYAADIAELLDGLKISAVSKSSRLRRVNRQAWSSALQVTCSRS